MEVEPLQYCVKEEPEDDDENSNFVGSDGCSEDGNGEQNIVMDVDPSASVMDDEDSEEEVLPNGNSLAQGNFEPVWMNTGTDDSENTNQSSQWICQYCNSNFPTEEKYNRHALIHTSVGIL